MFNSEVHDIKFGDITMKVVLCPHPSGDWQATGLNLVAFGVSRSAALNAFADRLIDGHNAMRKLASQLMWQNSADADQD